MLAVFEKSIGKPPKELSLPAIGRNCLNGSPAEMAETFRSWRSDSTFYNLPNGNFLALSHEDENPVYPRHYGMSRQATEAMIVIEAYKVLRDRAPYPADQVVKELEGKFAFILFDSKASTLFLSRDRDGSVQLLWGIADDGSLVCTDDPNVISAACGKCYTPFPPGCIFMGGERLMSFEHPLNKVRGIAQEDDEGNISGVIFQVDLFTRLHSIPRTDSAANWANATLIERD